MSHHTIDLPEEPSRVEMEYLSEGHCEL